MANTRSPKQQPSEDIPVADNRDIMVIIRIKMKCLSLKENGYGHNHFFKVLDISTLQDLIELRFFFLLKKCLFEIIMINSF